MPKPKQEPSPVTLEEAREIGEMNASCTCSGSETGCEHAEWCPSSEEPPRCAACGSERSEDEVAPPVDLTRSADVKPSTEPCVLYQTSRIKPLAEVRASDVPRGLSPEDVATDC